MDKPHPEGKIDAPSLPGGGTTQGNIIVIPEALLHDAGVGKSPAPGTYGRPAEYMYPSAGKAPGGTDRAIKAYFKGHGGGKP